MMKLLGQILLASWQALEPFLHVSSLCVAPWQIAEASLHNVDSLTHCGNPFLTQRVDMKLHSSEAL